MSRAAVFLDARWLKSGIGRYTRGLLYHVKANLPDLDLWCATGRAHLRAVSHHCDRVLLANSRIYSASEQLLLPWIARGAKLYHAPHYNAPILWSGKLVVTIHDLNHLLDERYRDSWRSRFYASPMLRTVAGKADRIITVSEYSKAAMVRLLHVAPEKITVIGCSIDPAFRLLSDQEISARLSPYFNRSRPYCLFVGDMRPNKNLPTLLRALALFRSRRREYPLLILAGGDSDGWRQLAQEIETLGLTEDVLWLASVSDTALTALYGGAEMTIMPSRQEGFGLPIIESMSCGTPVLCANAASLPEVADGAALLFDPDSPEDLMCKMERLLDSTDLRVQLSSAGLKRASFFTAERQAALHARVYREVLQA